MTFVKNKSAEHILFTKAEKGCKLNENELHPFVFVLLIIITSPQIS